MDDAGVPHGRFMPHTEQLAYMRPHNQYAQYRNLHFIDASWHPKAGVSSVLPYAVWEPEELYLPSPCCYTMIGMAFDVASGRVFITERGLGEGEMNAAVVHVWSVSPE